jgi:hypothetical protein
MELRAVTVEKDVLQLSRHQPAALKVATHPFFLSSNQTDSISAR